MKTPGEHEYITEDYPLARKTRDLFKSLGKLELLGNSVKLNLNFFRTKSDQDWEALDVDMRTELENFCTNKVREIVTRLKPKIVIAEGIGKTYPRLKEILFDGAKDLMNVKGSNGRNIYISCGNNAVKLIGIIHLSGARVSADELVEIGKNLSLDLKF